MFCDAAHHVHAPLLFGHRSSAEGTAASIINLSQHRQYGWFSGFFLKLNAEVCDANDIIYALEGRQAYYHEPLGNQIAALVSTIGSFAI